MESMEMGDDVHVVCHCGEQARTRTSWTLCNPGRRFMGFPEFEVVSFVFLLKFVYTICFVYGGSRCLMKMKHPEAAGCGFFQSTKNAFVEERSRSGWCLTIDHTRKRLPMYMQERRSLRSVSFCHGFSLPWYCVCCLYLIHKQYVKRQCGGICEMDGRKKIASWYNNWYRKFILEPIYFSILKIFLKKFNIYFLFLNQLLVSKINYKK